jgi:hypothetical protein
MRCARTEARGDEELDRDRSKPFRHLVDGKAAGDERVRQCRIVHIPTNRLTNRM